MQGIPASWPPSGLFAFLGSIGRLRRSVRPGCDDAGSRLPSRLCEPAPPPLGQGGQFAGELAQPGKSSLGRRSTRVGKHSGQRQAPAPWRWDPAFESILV